MIKNICTKKKIKAKRICNAIDKFSVELSQLKEDFKNSIREIEENPAIEKINPNPYVVFDELTNREIEVLDLLAHGFCAKDISETLCISRGTTTTYLMRIYDKMGLQINENPHLYNKQIIAVLAYLRHIGVLKTDWKIKVGDLNA